MKSVAIIGGGITGLVAAFRLQEHKIPVVLYEAAGRVGGPIQTILDRGYLAECGPNTILETSPLISKLVRDLRLESRRLYSDPVASTRYIAKNGRPEPLPTSALKFAKTPLFSGGAKLRLALEPFIRRSPEAQEESVAEFVVRRLGAEFLDYAINPLVAGIYAGDPARLSVKEAFPKLHSLEQRYGSLIAGQFLGARERKRRGGVSKQNAPKFSFDEGLEVLTSSLRARLALSIRLNRRICRFERSPDSWRVTSDGPTDRTTEEHSAVVLAIPAEDLASLEVAGVRFPALAPLKRIDYPPVASVVLGFRRDDVKHALDGFGVLVPEAERMRILGIIFSSSLFPGRAPAGHVAVTAYLGGSRAPDLALSGSEKLIEYTVRDLERLIGANGRPTYQHCFLFRKAIPQYNVGYGYYKNLMAQAEAVAPGLMIGGQVRCGISISDSIISGHNLADRAELYLAKSQHRPSPGPIYAPAY